MTEINETCYSYSRQTCRRARGFLMEASAMINRGVVAGDGDDGGDGHHQSSS